MQHKAGNHEHFKPFPSCQFSKYMCVNFTYTVVLRYFLVFTAICPLLPCLQSIIFLEYQQQHSICTCTYYTFNCHCMIGHKIDERRTMKYILTKLSRFVV